VALERDQHVAQPVEAARAAAVDAVPGGQEPAERVWRHGLDLGAQDGERRPADAPEHVGVAPLATGPAGP
jgi:hypothetical protein